MEIRQGTYQMMRSMNHNEYEALKESILEMGVLEPIKVDQEGFIIDGHHRFMAHQELRKNGADIPDIPFIIIATKERESAMHLNTARRHLRGRDIKTLISNISENYPDISNAEIARRLGCSRNTVIRHRKISPKNHKYINSLNASECESNEMMQAPFYYYGGKARVAGIVWRALGHVRTYIEPFFGSGAVLLKRPGYDPVQHIEIVGDKDGYIANVWRAIKYYPDEVVKYCDWPINHADLAAKRKYLVGKKKELLQNLIKDHKWCDPELAGFWIWMASCWVGDSMTDDSASYGICGRAPRVTIVHGINKANLADHLDEWIGALSTRLRKVRVVCGDWQSTLRGKVLQMTAQSNCGVFLDPPDSLGAGRQTRLFGVKDDRAAQDAREWALGVGNDPRYRIVLAGYYEEHIKECVDAGWSCYRWIGNESITGSNLQHNGKQENLREALFFSPHCITNEIKGLITTIPSS